MSTSHLRPMSSVPAEGRGLAGPANGDAVADAPHEMEAKGPLLIGGVCRLQLLPPLLVATRADVPVVVAPTAEQAEPVAQATPPGRRRPSGSSAWSIAGRRRCWRWTRRQSLRCRRSDRPAELRRFARSATRAPARRDSVDGRLTFSPPTMLLQNFRRLMDCSPRGRTCSSMGMKAPARLRTCLAAAFGRYLSCPGGPGVRCAEHDPENRARGEVVLVANGSALVPEGQEIPLKVLRPFGGTGTDCCPGGAAVRRRQDEGAGGGTEGDADGVEASSTGWARHSVEGIPTGLAPIGRSRPPRRPSWR